MPQVVTGAALGTDVLAMAGILGLIVLFGLLYRYRRQSATWGRIAKLAPLVAGTTYLASSFLLRVPPAYLVLAVAVCVSVLWAHRRELRPLRASA